MTATATHPVRTAEQSSRRRFSDPVDQAFWILRLGFVVAPIVFGADKFAHVLTNWDKYLAPQFSDLLDAKAHTLMYAVGAIEIVAGLIVLVRPRIGAWVVAAWLAGIIVNLLLLGDYYDVALRDFGLLLAAVALARLAVAVPSGRRARRAERVAP
jgi:hypothetical protein